MFGVIMEISTHSILMSYPVVLTSAVSMVVVETFIGTLLVLREFSSVMKIFVSEDFFKLYLLILGCR